MSPAPVHDVSSLGNGTSPGGLKEKCEPNKVKRAERCDYVRSHKSCSDDDNLVHYLKIHYCTFKHIPGVSIGIQVRRERGPPGSSPV